MKMYDCVLENNPELCWAVYESATEQIIDRYMFQEDAMKHMKFLRSGGGFAGHTPAFLFNNYKKKVQVNLRPLK